MPLCIREELVEAYRLPWLIATPPASRPRSPPSSRTPGGLRQAAADDGRRIAPRPFSVALLIQVSRRGASPRCTTRRNRSSRVGAARQQNSHLGWSRSACPAVRLVNNRDATEPYSPDVAPRGFPVSVLSSPARLQVAGRGPGVSQRPVFSGTNAGRSQGRRNRLGTFAEFHAFAADGFERGTRTSSKSGNEPRMTISMSTKSSI